MRHTDFEIEFENTDAFKWLRSNAAKYPLNYLLIKIISILITNHGTGNMKAQ